MNAIWAAWRLCGRPERKVQLATGDQRINLDTLLRRSRPRRSECGEGEAKLDSLLEFHSRQEEERELKRKMAAEQRSPLDKLRELFETELVAAFDQLRSKYADKGIVLELDAVGFLNGGRGLRITIEFAGVGMRFDGTVMSNAIAFQQTRYSSQDRSGLTASGPTLRTRNLSAELFREFVCARIAALVQSVVQKRA